MNISSGDDPEPITAQCMYNYLKIYNWIWLCLRITFSYFGVCWIAVLVAIALGIDDEAVRGGFSIWSSIKIFLGYSFISIPVSVFILSLLTRFLKNVKQRKISFLILSVFWHFLAINSLSGSANFADDKGIYNVYLFNGIMLLAIAGSHIFWLLATKSAFENDPPPDQILFKTGVVKFFIVYYLSILIASLFSIYNLSSVFDGFILDEMLMSFVGNLTVVILGCWFLLILIKRLKFRFLLLILIPVVYLSYDFFINTERKFYIPLNDFTKFRVLVVHYNPLWLEEDERGHFEPKF